MSWKLEKVAGVYYVKCLHYSFAFCSENTIRPNIKVYECGHSLPAIDLSYENVCMLERKYAENIQQSVEDLHAMKKGFQAMRDVFKLRKPDEHFFVKCVVKNAPERTVNRYNYFTDATIFFQHNPIITPEEEISFEKPCHSFFHILKMFMINWWKELTRIFYLYAFSFKESKYSALEKCVPLSP